MGKHRGRKRNNQISINLTTSKRNREKDLGTPELQAKRLALAKSGNPEDTTDALSMLYSLGHINDNQRRAGTLFTIAFYYTFGKPFARCSRYGDISFDCFGQPGAANEETGEYDERMNEFYKKADNELRLAGRRVRDVTKNVTVYDKLPGWFQRGHWRPAGEEGCLCLIAGLDVLVEVFEIAA